VFFTESRYDVTVPSVTSPRHVIDLHAYTAPSVDWPRGRRGGLVCHLANVYHNDVEMGVDTAPFSLQYPGNNYNRSSDSDNDDKLYCDDNSCMSLYARPRDVAAEAAESRDPGLCHSLR